MLMSTTLLGLLPNTYMLEQIVVMYVSTIGRDSVGII